MLGEGVAPKALLKSLQLELLLDFKACAVAHFKICSLMKLALHVHVRKHAGFSKCCIFNKEGFLK